jgi:prephenate dehydratase
MKKTIAIQGVKGAFHHEAAALFYQGDFDICECMSFHDLVDVVESGKANQAVMAIENSLVGSMLPNLAIIRKSTLHIVGEIYMRISQNLMALPGESIQSLREVHSHPMAIMQCERFFHQYPGIRLVESADTALSALEIREKNLTGIGAIASEAAARIYGLEILAPSIETNKKNYTRFLILGHNGKTLDPHVSVKASVAFVAPHVPGSLAAVLQQLAQEDVNLSMIQSLPLVSANWEYIFHADMIFKNVDHARTVIKDLRKALQAIWVMGVYPMSPEIAENTQSAILAAGKSIHDKIRPE